MSEITIDRITPQVNIDTATRNYHLPVASETQLGGIKVGNNLTIEEDGTLNADSIEYNLPVATSSSLGGVKIGDHLNMSNDVLSVVVDSNLSATSTHPVENSAVTSSVNTLTSNFQTLNSTLSNLTSTVTNLNTTVGHHTTVIASLETTVAGHTSTLSTLSDTVDDNSTSITSLNNTTSDLDDRLDTAESNITALTNGSTELTGDVAILKTKTEAETTYSHLLPVSTWTAGSIRLEKRGYVGFYYIDLEGSLSLNSGSSTTIFTLTNENIPDKDAIAVLETDDGSIICEINGTTGVITFENISAHNQNITKVKGVIPVVF